MSKLTKPSPAKPDRPALLSRTMSGASTNPALERKILQKLEKDLSAKNPAFPQELNELVSSLCREGQCVLVPPPPARRTCAQGPLLRHSEAGAPQILVPVGEHGGFACHGHGQVAAQVVAGDELNHQARCGRHTATERLTLMLTKCVEHLNLPP